MPLNQTCVQCAQSKVRCDKKIPCGRCSRRGTICTSQPRKRGRSAREETVWVEGREESKRPHAVPSQKTERFIVPPTNGETPMPASTPFHTHDAASTVSDFLSMVFRWLSQEFVPSDDTWRAAIIMQSFIQTSVNNNETLDLVLRICKILNIDGNECLRWCRSRSKVEGALSTIETFVIDLGCLKLPPYMEEFAHIQEKVFLYAYHNGQQTFASTKPWDVEFRDASGLLDDSRTATTTFTFLDAVSRAVVIPLDQRDFLARSADLIVRGKSSREERSCIIMCVLRSGGGLPQPCMVSLRLWSDTGTDSFMFAVKVVPLPKSKYLHLNLDNLKRSKELALALPSQTLIESTQRLVERKKWDSKWKAERDLLTEEQLLAAMLPLDEVLELDELDIEAVAEYLHG